MDLLAHTRFTGPALPEPFVRYELERELAQRRLLPKATGAEGERVQQAWESYRRTLRELVAQGGAVRVRTHVLEPLATRLGYASLELAPDVATREGLEAGGYLFVDGDGRRLRAWSTALGEDLDAPARRGHAYRYSHARIAQRVLLASGEQAGLLTNGLELRLLLSNPAGRDSEISIPIDPVWKRSRDAPDSYYLLLALASPAGVQAVPALVEKARLQQTRVTKELRVQARQAVEQFVQELLDHPANQALLAAHPDRAALAAQLWREGLIFVYRLLFILKLEASDDPAQAFGFASTSLWRHTFSPSMALAGYARAVLDEGAETGRLLEEGVRGLFRMFTDGVQASELHVKPLGGVLFGPQATPLLAQLRWSERGVAHLLDRLLWTPQRRGAGARQRVHYGPLDVKDLGRVYEALLELEPGAAAEPMCRLRRQKLEVVVPLAQGARYQVAGGTLQMAGDSDDEEEGGAEGVEGEDDDTLSAARSPRSAVQWVEAIPAGRFYLRAGLGRKSSGSFYTPDPFVTFLVQETLGPLVERVSPRDDPQPLAILSLKVIDDACGSGHFIVESDRFLGDKLYEACRLCDERALEAERQAEKARSAAERERLLGEAVAWRQRVVDLPDPNDELVLYLPSRAPEGEESGLSQRKALALCKRLVAVHCLYGVDKNPLAVELARLALWIETQAEGLPLTFLDHRIVVGDSLTGPFFHHLLTLPGSQQSLEGLYSQGLSQRFSDALRDALGCVADLEASIGSNQAETEAKQAAKARLDRALAPFRIVAAAWAGGVMLGPAQCDDEGYLWLACCVAESGDLPADLAGRAALQAMIARGLGVDAVPAGRDALLALLASGQCVPALPFELAFPEVFYPTGDLADRRGFHVTLGNPPWDAIQFKSKEFFAAFDFEIMSAPTQRERTKLEKRLLDDPQIGPLFEEYKEAIEQLKRANDVLYKYQKVQVEGDLAGRQLDFFRVFMERNAQLLTPDGVTGVVVPSAFHANEGATGVRKLYLEEMGLEHCYSFENRRKLFEIDSRFKFALVIARRQGPTGQFNCAFYLHDDEWLFGDRASQMLTYSLDLVRNAGGPYLTFLEIVDKTAVEIADVMMNGATSFKESCERVGIRLQKQPVALDMAKEAWRFRPSSDFVRNGDDARHDPIRGRLVSQGVYYLAEGKTFHQFDDLWGDPPQYCVPLENLGDNPLWVHGGRYYRLAMRAVASSTNERTGIFCLLSPGAVAGHSVALEREPHSTPRSTAMTLCGLCNSYAFDWTLRLMTAANVTLFVLSLMPIKLPPFIAPLLLHSTLRLTCNHAGYAPLWREQLGDTWREATPPFTWPVLAGPDARWAVRAAIDAVIAQAYGLDRAQYAHVLSTFSHRSHPQAPALCLARFDELTAVGLDAFTKRWDPYWDVPLNESLPEAVIELPVVARDADNEQQLELGI